MFSHPSSNNDCTVLLSAQRWVYGFAQSDCVCVSARVLLDWVVLKLCHQMLSDDMM